MTAETAQLMEEELMAYYASKKREWDQYAVETTAEARGMERATLEKNTTFVKKLLLKGDYSVEEIAEIAEVSVDFVLEIKNNLPSA